MEKFESDDEKDILDKKIYKAKKDKEKTSIFISTKTIIILVTLFILFILFFIILKKYSKEKSNPLYYNVLIGDIGGMNSRLRLYNMTSNISITPYIYKEENFSTVKYDSLESLLKFFLSDINPSYKPNYAFISIPGPIEDNKIITLQNIPHWVLDNGTELGNKLDIDNFFFINDFVVNGYAIQTKLIKDKDYLILNDVQPKKSGAKLMIGPGTGLGMGYLLKNEGDKYYTIGSSEGGGRDYSPKTKLDLDLRNFIKKEANLENVSFGKICSSKSLIPIYKFLHLYENNNSDENPKYKREKNLAKKIDNFNMYNNLEKINEINSELILKGIKDECQLSKKTLFVFIEIFGEIAGDLALFSLAYNGVYLLGRLTREITPLILDTTIFMDHFKNKDHFWFLLERIPVYLVQNENIELIGVTEAARRYFEDIENK